MPFSCGSGRHHEPRLVVGVAGGGSARPYAGWGGLTYPEGPKCRGRKTSRVEL
ncbi:hypothetical protein E1A91_D13G056400v1 [Gossypium mustelinum]|uniref:Uncharacterized protein n=1 Tax=Gossypium mustelinum TaxID=34275 RepID=A0A5D2S0T1_GOSMU|nr:hypothetical protein E1A91_D13G056400v1 [Gossypium mustelinum]